jgi:ATP-dependent Lon protease
MFLSLYQVKEKTIAARRSAIKTLIFPAANKRDFDELASNVKDLIVN